MKTFIASLLLLSICARAATIPFNGLNPSQFDTNGLVVKYIADWTNDFGGVISPITSNFLVTVTNQNVYGTWSTPSKVTLLSLGTNQLDMTLQSAWLLNSPTNDATQVILSLSAGAYQGQHAFLLSQNGDESFTLPNMSEQYDVPGALVVIGSDWIGATNRGIHLVYSAPDWVLEGIPTDPSVPGGGGGGGTNNPLWGLVGGTTLVPQPPVGLVSVVSTLADNATNVALVVDTAVPWTEAQLFSFRNGGTNIISYGLSTGLEMFADFAAIGLAGNLVAQLYGEANSDYFFQFYADSTDAALYLGGDAGNTIWTSLSPTIASTGSSVAYLFDTKYTLTNGDFNLLVKHAGTNMLTVGPSGTTGNSDSLTLLDPNGYGISLKNTAGNISQVAAAGSTAGIELIDSGSKYVRWFGQVLHSDTNSSIGSTSAPWKDITTINPTGAAVPWKLGRKLSGSVLTLTTNYYEVVVDGVVGAIPIVTVTP